MSNIPRPTTIDVLEKAPYQGLFDLTFTNSRKSGMRPVQTHHCQGCLYQSGHVHLDTQAVRVTHFGTLSQMCEYLEQFGCFRIEWENEL